MATKKKTPQEQGSVKLEVGEQKEFKRTDDFVSLYVNNTQFGYTRFDFQIMFGRVEISRDNNYNQIQETAVVTMTPEYAKALLTDFAKVLMQYEQAHGEIKIRPDVTAQD